MNYFAHGIRYLDDPVFLVGTAVPDLLSACDRRTRVRTKTVEPFLTDDDPFVARLAGGIRQHLFDDDWFHRSRAFTEVSMWLSARFRECLDPGDQLRPGFLGHITTELLIDSALVEDDPSRLDRYFEAFTQVDPDLVQTTVNRMAKRPSENLAKFLRLFAEVQFLRDYDTDAGLRMRLSGVLKRVTLDPLPERCEPVLAAARVRVRDNLRPLLHALDPWPL